MFPRALVQTIVIHRTFGYPTRPRPLQLIPLSPGLDRTRTLRGAACGAAAAWVWALQQPFDKRVFSSEYDDVELLGKSVTRSEGWLPLGLALHAGNGALFGAIYANLAPAMPIPAALRGPVAALVEHLALWPLGALSDRFHPARKDLPSLKGNRAAFAQAAWRHLLFGLVLGELERRVNVEPEPAPPERTGRLLEQRPRFARVRGDGPAGPVTDGRRPEAPSAESADHRSVRLCRRLARARL